MTEKTVPIILLDDDATLRALLIEGWGEAGYAVEGVSDAASARSALAAVEGHALLVADRTLEGGGPNGFQLASEALEQYPALRVIYTSGTHIAVRRRALGERERALLKPFAMTQLLGVVRELS